MPDLTIIIVSYNARADLERCVASLLAHPPRVSHEIVVVDNQSTDGSADAVRGRPGVTVIQLGSNVGFARANNLGIRQTSSEHVLLLNSDTVVPPDAIDRLVDLLRRRPDVAVVGPRLVDGEGRAEMSYGRMLGPWVELQRKVLVHAHARRMGAATRMVERATRQQQTPDWVSGACLLVRRRDAEAVGLLDERYFMYEEDVDFCAAIRRQGRLVLFTPDTEVVHLRGRSAATAPAATKKAYRRSQLAFYQKHHPGWAAILRTYRQLRRQL